MAKNKKKIIYECQYCGHQSLHYLGKCPNCGEWESFIENIEPETKSRSSTPSLASSSPSLIVKSDAVPITEIEIETIQRISTGDNELNIVLGGGFVRGSLILIGGSPGIGKSTLLLKVAGNLSKEHKVLYVSGEESASQIKLRANRIDVNEPLLYLYSEIEFEEIASKVHEGNFKILVIDSIQTIYTNSNNSAPGSVGQVRAVTFELMRLAKKGGITIFIIGHITKDGAIAGPRVLEHMVDVVLYFEGEPSSELRILRGFKNRFGNTNEIGLFEMNHGGLISAKNIASKFFSRSRAGSGSALTVIMEGSRPLIVEVQALVSESFGQNPKRSVNGFDYSRLNMLLALLEKKLEIPLNRYDVFINITGGIKISETASDLSILASIVSSFRDRPLSKESVFIGEVSLIGDVREVFNIDQRLREAISQGIKRAIIPKKPIEKLKIECFEVEDVVKIIDWM
jgi:DNA repair protein RadA/Sms